MLLLSNHPPTASVCSARFINFILYIAGGLRVVDFVAVVYNLSYIIQSALLCWESVLLLLLPPTTPTTTHILHTVHNYYSYSYYCYYY